MFEYHSSENKCRNVNMGQIYKYVLQIHKILTQQWMWYPSINKVPEIAILFFGCQVRAAHFFETSGDGVTRDGRLSLAVITGNCL